jgi:hypothetical protein
VLHLAARAMGVVTGLAALEPDPRAPGADVLLDAALQAATGLHSSWPSGMTAPTLVFTADHPYASGFRVTDAERGTTTVPRGEAFPLALEAGD